MQHIIQKQILDVRLQNNERAIEKQQVIRKLYWERILPAMDKVFSDLIPSNKILRLEQLELDLGYVEMNDLEKTILRQIKSQLSDALVEAEYKKESNFLAKAKNITITNRSELLIDDIGVYKAFLFFIKNGIYPWWFSSKKQNTTHADLWDEILQKNKGPFLEFLSTNEYEIVWERLEKQFTTQQLIQLLSPEQLKVFRDLQELVGVFSREDLFFIFKKNMLSISSSQLHVYIEQVLKKIICLSFKKNTKAETSSELFLKQEFINLFIKKVALSPVQFYNLLIKIIKSKKEQLTTTEAKGIKNLGKIVAKKYQLATITLTGKKERIKKADPQKLKQNQELKNKPINDKAKIDLTNDKIQKTKDELFGIEKELQKANIKKVLEEGVYINNGGLVILAPFLKMYFEKLRLLEKHAFASKELHERAVQLSYYLVTGSSDISEDDCLLNKVLCGWPLEEPLQRTFELNEKEKEESDTLLKAVLEHWGGLGKSGIGALREGFLLRDAKLIDAGEQYKLIVERKTLDILMDKIPWSFRAVKLSWMEKRLLVEW